MARKRRTKAEIAAEKLRKENEVEEVAVSIGDDGAQPEAVEAQPEAVEAQVTVERASKKLQKEKEDFESTLTTQDIVHIEKGVNGFSVMQNNAINMYFSRHPNLDIKDPVSYYGVAKKLGFR